MSSQNRQSTQKKSQKVGTYARAALIISLVVISIIPIFVTFAPKEWPPQLPVLVIDAVYLLILVGYILVLTEKYCPRWLVITMSVVGVIVAIGVSWLALTLTTLEIRW